MSGTLFQPSDLFSAPTFLPRFTRQDARSIERAVGAQTLFSPGTVLQGAIIEASYAASEPGTLKTLAQDNVPRIFDLQTLRFGSSTFLDVEKLRTLPYAPTASFTPFSAERHQIHEMTAEALRFQQDREASAFLTVSVPLRDSETGLWLDLNERLTESASNLIGRAEIERKPLFCQIAPGRKVLLDPSLIVDRLMDYPVDAVHVQPLRLLPTRDGIEKLCRYVEFLMALRQAGLEVVASRVGAFGLVLQALGISSFDSGLGSAESSDLASLTRPRSVEETRENESRRGQGRDRRVYFEALKTTLSARHAQIVLQSPQLRGVAVCDRPCCAYAGLENLPERRREHFLMTRLGEVADLREVSQVELRLDLVRESLLEAREHAVRVHRVLVGAGATGVPSFEHLRTWIGVLNRKSSVPH